MISRIHGTIAKCNQCGVMIWHYHCQWWFSSVIMSLHTSVKLLYVEQG